MAASPAWGAAVPRAGAASAGRGDLLLPLLGLCSLLDRGRWGCAAIAPRRKPASPSPGRRRSSLLSQPAPAGVTVRGKLRPVPPSTPSRTAQARADTHPPPAPRLAGSGQGLWWGTEGAGRVCENFVHRSSLSPSLSRFGKGMSSIGARSENIGDWYQSSPLVTEKRGGAVPEGMEGWERGACSGPGGRHMDRKADAEADCDQN